MRFKALGYQSIDEGSGYFVILSNFFGSPEESHEVHWNTHCPNQEEKAFDYHSETGEDLFETKEFKSLEETKQWCKNHLKKIKKIVTKNEM